MKHLKGKISKVLVLYIVLFSSVVTLILTAIQLRIDYKDGVDFINQRIDQIKLTNADSITQSLWTLDSSSIQIQLNGLSRINDISLVKITDQDNKIIASSGKINSNDTITRRIPLSRIYRKQNTSLGTLTIVATKENLYQKLIDTVIIILISQAIKTFLVSMFVLIIFYYLVTRHLEKISNYSAKFTFSEKPEPLKLARKDAKTFYGDELERVVNAINSTSENMYESYKELSENQDRLAEREAKFSAIFDAISDAVVFVDTERKIIQTNPAFDKQFGYTLEEIKGQTTKLLYAKPEEYGVQGKKRYNPDPKINVDLYEIEYQRKDASTFISETLGGIVKLSDGSVIGYIGIIRDITDRIKAKEEEHQLQLQLQQAQKIEAIGQLTGGIAHDFNNILNSILGYSDLSLMSLGDQDNDDLKSYIEQIIQASERASGLVAQMLSFSRSNPGTPMPIQLPILIDEVTSLLRPTIPSSIKLVVEIDEKIPTVLMDTTQMHQILMNLCINARDSMDNGGILKIKVSNQPFIDLICSSCKQRFQGEFVQITVEDNGTGIKPEVLDTIFEPFVSTKEVGKGTGMGLAVVHGILHNHKSHIVVEPKEKGGSLFHLLMPPLRETSDTVEIKTLNKPLRAHEGDTKHILVVDDEESIVLFLDKLLKSHGYKVTYTTSSTEALEKFKATPSKYDLIITDQTMPNMSGTEMIKVILQISPNIPVILCTGYSETIDRESAIEMGCSAYLEKPVKTQTLLHKMQDILYGS